MKRNRLLHAFLLLSFLCLPLAAQAQSQRGTIRAFSVTGDVQIRNDATGAVRQLTRGEVFRDGHTIITGNGATATLVQSNGSTIVVEPDTELSVAEFLQDPYDRTSLGSYTNLQEDPSQSQTRLRLNRGAASGNVKGLRSNSRYNIDLPTGSAGIRGTTWRAVVFLDLETGQMTTTVVNADGSIVYAYDPGTGELVETEIPPGQQIVGEATITTTTDPVTGEVEVEVSEVAISAPTLAEATEVANLLNEVSTAVRDAEQEQQTLPDDEVDLGDDFAPGDEGDDTGDGTDDVPAQDLDDVAGDVSQPEG